MTSIAAVLVLGNILGFESTKGRIASTSLPNPASFETWEPDHVAPAMGGTCPGLMNVDSGEVFEVLITASDKDSWKRNVGGTWQYATFGSTVHDGVRVTTNSGATFSFSSISYVESTGTFTYSHVITALVVPADEYRLEYDSYRAVDSNSTQVHLDSPPFDMGHTVRINGPASVPPACPMR